MRSACLFLLFGCLWAVGLSAYAVVQALRWFFLPHPHDGRPLLVPTP
jgi:hypothetical protein